MRRACYACFDAPLVKIMPELLPTPPSPESLVADLQSYLRNAAPGDGGGQRSPAILYWKIGEKIRQSVLGSERAGYGRRILATLSQELTGRFGRGWRRASPSVQNNPNTFESDSTNEPLYIEAHSGCRTQVLKLGSGGFVCSQPSSPSLFSTGVSGLMMA